MKRSREKEMMDQPGNPRYLLEEDLQNLRIINRYLGGYRGLLGYLRRLERRGEMKNLSFLDVGTGSGDIPVAVVRWAMGKGIQVRTVGLELDQVTVEVARRQTRSCPEISLVRADAAHPPFSPSSFDFVHASQLLHHFLEEDIVALLRAWSKIARRAVLISDLVRHPLAYWGIFFLTRLFTRNPMTRTDAPLSVHRAFTVEEWTDLFEQAGIGEFHLFRIFPFRFVAVFPLDGCREAL